VTDAALAAADAEGDPIAQASARQNLGGMYYFHSHFELATTHFTQAVAFARRAGWIECEAVAINNLSRMHWVAGRLGDTITQLEQTGEPPAPHPRRRLQLPTDGPSCGFSSRCPPLSLPGHPMSPW
jgi:hypothetical protein